MAIGFCCNRCPAVFRDLGQFLDHHVAAHGVAIAEATPETLTNAPQSPPAPPGPPEAPLPDPTPAAEPPSRVAAIAAEWDAAAARRTRERQMRRAERRRTG